jgi:hypothetical protein
MLIENKGWERKNKTTRAERDRYRWNKIKKKKTA